MWVRDAWFGRGWTRDWAPRAQLQWVARGMGWQCVVSHERDPNPTQCRAGPTDYTLLPATYLAMTAAVTPRLPPGRWRVLHRRRPALAAGTAAGHACTAAARAGPRRADCPGWEGRQGCGGVCGPPGTLHSRKQGTTQRLLALGAPDDHTTFRVAPSVPERSPFAYAYRRARGRTAPLWHPRNECRPSSHKPTTRSQQHTVLPTVVDPDQEPCCGSETSPPGLCLPPGSARHATTSTYRLTRGTCHITLVR